MNETLLTGLFFNTPLISFLNTYNQNSLHNNLIIFTLLSGPYSNLGLFLSFKYLLL